MLATVIPSLRLRYPTSTPESLPLQSSRTLNRNCWCILKISIFSFVWLFSLDLVLEMTSTFQDCCASLLWNFSLSSLFQIKTHPESLTLIFLFSLLFRMQRARSSQSTLNFSRIQHHDAVSVLKSTHASWGQKRYSFKAWDWHPFGLCLGKFYLW